MAFSTPRTWTSGELVTDTILNAHIKDQFDALSSHAHSGSAGDGSSALSDLDTIIWDHQGSDPSAPAGGHGTVYLKSDGLYLRQTGGSASRLALASELHTDSHDHAIGVGQVVEASGGVYIDYAGGTTSEQTVVTTNITAGASNRSYIITATAQCTFASEDSEAGHNGIDPTIKLYYSTTVLETVTTSAWRVSDNSITGDATQVILSQTQTNPATSSTAIKITAQGTTGNAGRVEGMLSIREVYATDD